MSSTASGRRFLGRAALAFSTPVMIGAYVLYPQLVPLPWVTLVPWVILLTDDREPRASLWWFLPAAWMTVFLGNTVILRFGWFVAPIMDSILVVPWLPFPFLMAAIHRRFRWPRTLSVPIVWVAVEWVRMTFTLAHLDFYMMGNSQARVGPLVQIADLTGVYGVSFLIAMFNGLLADVILAARDRRAGVVDPGRRRRVVRAAQAFALTLAVVFAYGVARLARHDFAEGPRVAIVQPNTDHSERNTVGVHLLQVILTEERVPAGAADLILWPENAILDNLRRPGIYLPDLARIAREKGALMLVGGMDKVAENPGRTTNAAFLVDGNGAVLGEARKQVLFPWSERIPADGLLRRVAPPLWRLQRRLVRIAWGSMPTGIPADHTTALDMPWRGGALRFGVLVCLENVCPTIAAEASRLGARFLVNITSESRVGGPIQEQVLRASMMRAIENRVPFVRCGNSGISGFIDPKGRLTSVLRGDHGGTIFDSGVLVDRLALRREGGATLYARSHDAFALACVSLTVVLFALSWGRRGRGAAAVALAGLLGACGASPQPGRDAASAPGSLAAGRARLEAGDARGAIAPLAAACAAPAPCREAIPLLASAFRSTRRIEEGDEFFEALAEALPEVRPQALARRGEFLDELAELRAAEAVTAESARLDPQPETWAALGTLRMRMDQPSAAIDAYGHALALAPRDAQMRYLHARALWLAGRGDEARKEIDALVADEPGHGAAWSVMGRLRDAAGDRAGALDAYGVAIRGDPENVEARLMIARDALERGRIDEARRLLREIWAINAAGAARGNRR